MNPERPTDPREQMEVRITALLLGEASAFEESELLDAIKNDPELDAFYEEMRRMIGIVEETIQSGPILKIETLDAKPVLDEKRRGRLQKLFRKPHGEAIKLDTARNGAHQKAFLKKLTALAASFVLLGVSLWIFISSVIKPGTNRIQTSNDLRANGGQSGIAYQMHLQSGSPQEADAFANLSLPTGREDNTELFDREHKRVRSVQMNGSMNDSANSESENSENAQASFQDNVEEIASAYGRNRQQIASFDNSLAEPISSKREATKIFLPQQNGPETAASGENLFFRSTPIRVGLDTSKNDDTTTGYAEISEPKPQKKSYLNFSAPETDHLITELKKEKAAPPLTEPQLLERELGRKDSESSAAFGVKTSALVEIQDREDRQSTSTRGFRILSESLDTIVPNQPENQRRFAGAAPMLPEQPTRENAPRAGREAIIGEGFDNGAGMGGGNSGNPFGTTEKLAIAQSVPVPISHFNQLTTEDDAKVDSYAFSLSTPQKTDQTDQTDQTVVRSVAPNGRYDVPFNFDSDGAEKLGELKQLSEAIADEPVPGLGDLPSMERLFSANDSKKAEGATTWMAQRPEGASANGSAGEASLGLAVELASQDFKERGLERPYVTGTYSGGEKFGVPVVKMKPTAPPALATESGPKSLTPIPGNAAGKGIALDFVPSDTSLAAVQPISSDGLDRSSLGLPVDPATGSPEATRNLSRQYRAAVPYYDSGLTDESLRTAEEKPALANNDAFARGRVRAQIKELDERTFPDVQAEAKFVETEPAELGKQIASLSDQSGRAGVSISGGTASSAVELAGVFPAPRDRENPSSDIRNYDNRARIVDVNKARFEPVVESEQLTVENPVGDPDWIGVLERPISVKDKLENITLNEVQYEGVPLSEVVKTLTDEARRRDPDQAGVRFQIAPPVESDLASLVFPTDPATGAPVSENKSIYISSSIVELPTARKNLKLTEVLDAIVENADPPLKYAIEDDAVVFHLDEEKLAKRHAEESVVAPQVQPPSLEPRPEVQTAENAFSTFSLNVSDVSFKLAQASLENGQLPDGKRLRSEEFINAFDYHDPAPLPGQKLAFHWERSRNPFAFGRDLLRFSIQTAAAGRQADQPLNLVVLLDNSGSMERSDRVEITHQMLAVLADQLNPNDRISVISFARTARLWVDGMPGGDPAELMRRVGRLNPEGGTNLEDALGSGYDIAQKHYNNYANNRVILLTDGAANLGNVDPKALHEKVVEQRQRGIALDCFGVGWEGYNDSLLETLSRNGDGRYGFINRPEDAESEFADLLAGALQVAASDVKAQVEFNPARVTSYRQIGYLQHQLTKEQFRDNTVDAAEIGATEAGNALYVTQINDNGTGPIGTVRVRYRVPATGQYEEREWVLPYNPVSTALERSSPAMKLAATSASFAEWLAQSPHAAEVTLGELQNLLNGVPDAFSPDSRPVELQRMIQATRSITGQ